MLCNAVMKEARGQYRVDGTMRLGAVTALADDADDGLIDGSHSGIGDETEVADRHSRPVVQAENRIDWEAFEQSFRQHLAGAGANLFCRLENQP
jgi:hypothetical protein